MRFRILIGVDGFTEVEATEGSSYLLGYLQDRPWLIAPMVAWDKEAARIIIGTEVEGNEPEGLEAFVLDEVWDCVIAAIDFSSEGVHFELIEMTKVE